MFRLNNFIVMSAFLFITVLINWNVNANEAEQEEQQAPVTFANEESAEVHNSSNAQEEAIQTPVADQNNAEALAADRDIAKVPPANSDISDEPIVDRDIASQKIELSDEELAQESVLPVFNQSVAVRSRNVVTEGRIDTAVFYSYAMTEPIFSISRIGGNLFYNTSENDAYGVVFNKQLAGLSNYSDQLNKQYNLDFSRAPAPEMSIFGEYNLKMFYGKMSIAKNSVLNLSLYSAFGLGMVKYVHKSYPGLSVGIGHKFYLTNTWALRFDLRVLFHNAPIPFLEGKIRKTDTVPQYAEFGERFNINTTLDFGLSKLF